MHPLQSLDLAHVWHPFTQHDEWEADGPPLLVEAAEGCELIDVSGRRYLDGISSLWTNVHGHRHPTIDAAVRAQLDRVAHSTLLGLGSTQSTRLAARLAQLLAERLPDAGLTRMFYSDSGSSAVEVALKIAFQYQQQIGQTKRTRFAALSESYHGDTLGSVSVGGIELFHSIYRPLIFDTVRIPAPDTPDPALESACLARAESLLAEHGDQLAGLIVEPLVQGAAGMRMHSPAFLSTLLRMARDAGLVIIADEVATGFGRTGTMFAMEQVDARPDLLALAKGLSGGYLPLAVTAAAEHIFDAFRGPYTRYRTFFHGHTYTGNPLACAAAMGSLDVFEQEDTLAGLPEKIAALHDALSALRSPHIGSIRQKGLMAGIVLQHDRPDSDRIGHRVCMAARAHGVIVRPLGDVVVVMPALAMSPAQLHAVVSAIAVAIDETL